MIPCHTSPSQPVNPAHASWAVWITSEKLLPKPPSQSTTVSNAAIKTLANWRT